jgi:Integrase core domain
VARWKGRDQVLDRSTRPHRLATTMTDWEEALIVELRGSLALPLDDITEAMRRCVNPRLSRSAIHRCLQRHGISARRTADKAPAAAFHTDTPAGFIHIDVKYLPSLNRRRSYAYVAIDRATRFVYLEILPDRRAETAAGFLHRCRAGFPLKIHTVLTDNGSEFTDRFAVDKKGKPHDKPSGQHPSDRVCTQRAFTHRLARPFRPQTQWYGRTLQPPPRRASRPDAAKPHRPPPSLSRFMPNVTPTSSPSSPITTAPGCDASATRHPPNSLLNSRDTTPAPGQACMGH